MNWVIYAIAAAIALAAGDALVKLASGKIPDSLGMLLYGFVPFATGLLWCFLDRQRISEFALKPASVICGFGVGITFTLVTIGLYAAFRLGAPISLASPLIRLGGLILASLVGLAAWNEPANARYLIGLVFACSGLYLMVTR
jgi:drug/metabolite transporter (DMT)-like permease